MEIEAPYITQMMRHGNCAEYDSYWNIDRSCDNEIDDSEE